MSRTRRLWMVVHGEYPGDVRVAREARAAVSAGFSVEVFAARGPAERASESIDGVGVQRLPVGRRRDSGSFSFLAEYLAFAALAILVIARRALRDRPDVVQVHNPPDFLIVAGLVPRLLGARLVLDVHDLSSDMFAMRFGESRPARIAQRILEQIELLACRIADAVVTVHEPYRLELARRGVDAEKILVVLNSLDEALVPGIPRAPAREPFRVVYHGTVTPHYGLGLVIDAFARIATRVPGAELEIIGGGDAVSGLRERARELGLAGRVRLTGRVVPQADVLEHIQGASVGVIPNLPVRLNRFALSTKLFEYAALGIPVVAADLPTLRAHFSGDEVAYFRAGDADSLADALMRVAADYEAALARARAAAARYHESYGWREQARGYTTLLSLLAEHRPGAAAQARGQSGNA